MITATQMAEAKAHAAHQGGPLPVVEVKIQDCQTPKMHGILNDIRSRSKGKLVASTRRYIWSISVLRSECLQGRVVHFLTRVVVAQV